MQLRSFVIPFTLCALAGAASANDSKPTPAADKAGMGKDAMDHDAMGHNAMGHDAMGNQKVEKMPKGALNLAEWPADSRKVAEDTIAKYGQPDEATPTLLTWHHNGPWKHTYLSRQSTEHVFPVAHTDSVEMVVDYKVPPEKFDDLAAYDGSVNVDRTRGELSARCDKEAANFLALNLADDIIRGKKTVAEARAAYAKNIALSMKGEMPKIMSGLQFETKIAAADPDKPATQGMGN